MYKYGVKFTYSCLTNKQVHVIPNVTNKWIWLVGCLGFNGPDGISICIGPSPRDREREEKIEERKNVQTNRTRT